MTCREQAQTAQASHNPRAVCLLWGAVGPNTPTPCLCLQTALAGHLPASDWAAEDGSGGASVVQWIARQLNAQPSAVPGLLEMLAELPRESASYKIAIRPARRRQFSEELVASVPDALRLLGAFLSAQGGDQAVVNKLLSVRGLRGVLFEDCQVHLVALF